MRWILCGTTQKRIPELIPLVWPHRAGRGQDMVGVRLWALSLCPTGCGCFRPWEFQPVMAAAPVTALNIPGSKTIHIWISAWTSSLKTHVWSLRASKYMEQLLRKM